MECAFPVAFLVTDLTKRAVGVSAVRRACNAGYLFVPDSLERLKHLVQAVVVSPPG